MKYVVCGNYGATNLGDEAILDGIIGILNNADNRAEITVMSSNPKETFASHHIKAIYLMPAGFRSFFRLVFNGRVFSTLSAIKACDYFILGGGGLFSDEKFKAVWIWWFQAFWAFLLRKKVICLGQSVGPLNTRTGRFLTASVFKRADRIAVRDLSSKEQLAKLGIFKAEVLADPAFLLPIDEKNSSINDNYIIFSVRPWIKGDKKTLYKFCAHFIDWIYEEYGLKTILLPFQLYQDKDIAELNNIFDQVRYKHVAEIRAFSTYYRDAIDIISRSSAVIGMRLHSLIFSTICHKPFIALSYSQKVRQLCTDMGMEDYVIDWQSLDLADLKHKFSTLMEDRERIISHLAGIDVLMRHKAHRHEELFKKEKPGTGPLSA